MRIAALLSCVCLVASVASAADWPFFRGPEFNGISAETGWQATWPAGGPRVLWRKNVGIGAASFTTAGDRVLTMGNMRDKDIVTCFDAASGKPLWTFEYPSEFDKRQFEGGTAATPTIDVQAGRVYTLSYDGQLYCLDLADGKRVWGRHLVNDFRGRLSQWKYAGSPLVLGEMLIVDTGAKGGSTLALNKTTGEKIWAAGSDGAGYASPIPFEAAGTRGVMLFKAEHLVAHDLKDGRELWRIPWKTSYDVNASSPTFIDGKVLVSSGYASGRTALFDVSAGQPKKLWQNDDLKTKMSSPVVFNGRVYGITEFRRGALMCLDLATGNPLWEQAGFGKYGTLMVAGDKLVILSEDGQLVIAAAGDKYHEVSRGKLLGDRCWVAPVLSNGRIFAKNNNGDMAVVDVRPAGS